MELYYAPGTCSLSPRIVAEEAGIALDAERVDLSVTPHRTAGGADFTAIHANGYVPVLQLDDGSLLGEGTAIVQYLADLKPEAGLLAAPTTPQRYRQIAWLNFIATELHKMFSPWLFHPEYGEQPAVVARMKISQRLAYVETVLAEGGPFLEGERFAAPDAYLLTIVSWSRGAHIDLGPFPMVREFVRHVSDRGAVRRAMRAEGIQGCG